ncbi:MAG: hypothetical protein JW741_18635 [Sedimentisphaerales bacterium]|nr:hypothetical protein [Sedimentisphaerales bacterium]
MTARRALKWTHVVSTVWFVLCVVCVLILALHQAGFNSWLIFSLSGHSLILVFLLVSLYLFALFRGVRGAQQIEVEHPLTGGPAYMGFYVAAPLIGGLAGLFGMAGTRNPIQFMLGVAMGTLGTTFAIWVLLDPLAGLIEMLGPASRKHRAERLAKAEAERRERHERRERLLAEAFAREEQERHRWQQELQPQAERLATLLAVDADGFREAEREALDIGAQAWRLGGINCMREVRDMAVAISKERQGDAETSDYISYWWDGIGEWRKPSLC